MLETTLTAGYGMKRSEMQFPLPVVVSGVEAIELLNAGALPLVESSDCVFMELLRLNGYLHTKNIRKAWQCSKDFSYYAVNRGVGTQVDLVIWRAGWYNPKMELVNYQR